METAATSQNHMQSKILNFKKIVKCYIQFVRMLMKRKLDPDFSDWRIPPASVDPVNKNKYQLICIGD